MTVPPTARRRGRRLLTGSAVVGTAALVLATAALVLPGVAAADPVGSAQSRAAALAAQVGRLQTQAEVAVEHYDEIETELGQAVTDHLLAQTELEQIQQQSRNGQSAFQDQIRALYQDGGQLGLMATVLSGDSFGDVVTRYQDAVSVLHHAQVSNAGIGSAVLSAATVAHQLAVAAATATTLQQAARQAAAVVEADLAQTQQLLAAATSQVRELEAEAVAAAAARSAAQASAALITAQGATFSNTVPPNSVAAAAIVAARSRLGDTYVWGGSGPTVFDCSGLTQWAYAQAGVALPRVAADQYNAGPHVALNALAPGDLLFWATDVNDPTTIHHVGMYLGDGMMIDSPHTGTVVQIQPVWFDGYIGATRPTGTLAGPATGPATPNSARIG
ncbi:MAG TPA: NlpC/P60 family protein [Mycobacteriales bacterium]|nr:NlpC/P60 family protein [Mycobacteriales bacterium]